MFQEKLRAERYLKTPIRAFVPVPNQKTEMRKRGEKASQKQVQKSLLGPISRSLL